ncbi:MAG: hypothetical protein AB7Q42_06495 [Acidimicrobiia bacterium]
MTRAAPARWDGAAIREGASVAVLFAVPFTIVARLAFDDDAKSGWAALLGLGSFLGFVLGAGVAAWRQRRGAPLSHGVATAIGVFVVVQFVFGLIRLAGGNSLHLGKIIVSLSLTALAGLIGGFLGSFLQRQGMTSRR